MIVEVRNLDQDSIWNCQYWDLWQEIFLCICDSQGTFFKAVHIMLHLAEIWDFLMLFTNPGSKSGARDWTTYSLIPQIEFPTS